MFSFVYTISISLPINEPPYPLGGDIQMVKAIDVSILTRGAGDLYNTLLLPQLYYDSSRTICILHHMAVF